MQKWEYLSLRIDGHNKTLDEAENMLVTTSDGRWRDTKMPTNPMAIVNQLGRDGWEIVGSFGYSSSVIPAVTFNAMFKRPLP